jgi:S-adenosylmethionine:tRNA ribosyltransferase-isomerase
MKAASAPRTFRENARLLHIDPRAMSSRDALVRDLPSLLAPGDLLVVNDAATLPASLHTRDGAVEVRLLHPPGLDGSARAVLFGRGDYRTPTERREDPPRLIAGERLLFGDDLGATLTSVDAEAPRFVTLRFDHSGAALYRALYRNAVPIQYAYVPEPLPLHQLQTGFASRPWAVEMPSAGRPLTFSVLRALREAGIELSAVTHAAGISSTGSDALDRKLPLPERFAIEQATVDAVARARHRGARVIAAGTTVVRALEASAAAHDGALRAGEGEATLVIGPGFRPRLVDGLLTGMHPAGTSHFALLTAFAPRSLLEAALEQASRAGYLEHELGDSCLVLG